MQGRKLAVGVIEVIAIPVIVISSALPRRQFNLPRLIASSDFRAVRGEYVAWQDHHYNVIEQGAPWLHLAGRDVYETCRGTVPRSPALLDFSPRRTPAVRCTRHVTAVYGFDGPQAERLRSLERAFPVAGWEVGPRDLTGSWADISDAALTAVPDTLPAHRRWMAYKNTLLRWRPGAAVGHPAYGEETPPWGDRRPLAPSMRVSWMEAGQKITASRDPNRVSTATRNLLPLDQSDVQLPELLATALRRHDHALSVTMDLGYYVNTAPRSRPHRVRRHLLPTR